MLTDSFCIGGAELLRCARRALDGAQRNRPLARQLAVTDRMQRNG